jgi:4-hydroxybenzoate polyprenyltransferase
MSDFTDYWRLMRFDKPIGILLLLWPTWWALWLASGGPPPLKILAIFTAGVIIMRTAGDIINDIADRHIDGAVQRTRLRPLAAKTISVRRAFILFVLLCAMAGALTLFLNRLTIYLAILGLCLACLYPFTKRVTHWPQAFLGLAYSWGIPMAFAAQLNKVPWSGWWLFATSVLWVIAFDTFYAMVDRPDDIKIGVKSTAVLWGEYDRWVIAGLQLAVLLSLAMIAVYYRLGWTFYVGWGVASLLAVYQQYLIRHREPAACFRAFLNNHWFGCALFLGLWSGLPGLG